MVLAICVNLEVWQKTQFNLSLDCSNGQIYIELFIFQFFLLSHYHFAPLTGCALYMVCVIGNSSKVFILDGHLI